MSDSASQIVVITTTVPTLAVAEQLAKRLVEQKMAACVQITGQSQSIYEWAESVKMESEFSVKIKIGTFRLHQVVDFLKSNHPYQLPEIVWETVQATAEYCQWVDRQCRFEPY